MKELIAFLNSTVNDGLNNLSCNVLPMFSLQAGAANGYVAVPKDHPYYGLGYDDVNVKVHGGLTFSCPGNNLPESWQESELVTGNLHDLKDYWVFGFDTCHHGDSLETWPRDRVIEEVLSLKKQLEEVYE